MNSTGNISAFTLIEVIVVISIVSILLLFSFPMISDMSIFNSQKGQAGDIAQVVQSLKKKAVSSGHDYFLHLDRTNQAFWVTHENMDEAALDTAKENAVRLSSKTVITDVRFAASHQLPENEDIIRFSKKGYCDYALIYLKEDERLRTVRIDSFLSQSRIVDDHAVLQECI